MISVQRYEIEAWLGDQWDIEDTRVLVDQIEALGGDATMADWIEITRDFDASAATCICPEIEL